MSAARLAAALGASALAAALAGVCTAAAAVARDASGPPGISSAHQDPRLRTVLYSTGEIYRLPGYIGYQIDLEFEPGERFVGLGAGDVQGLEIAAEANHLFIKPRALNVRTNLTVLTTRRTYHFDYATLPLPPDPDHADVVYVLRFLYPADAPAPHAHAGSPPLAPTPPETLLAQAQTTRQRNTDYWYCGRRELQPVAVWDDGVQTHLSFNPRTELPAVFVRNDDGSESLLNYHVEHGEVVVHRIARRFVLRRGGLTGCIVNKGFSGSGAALPTGTISPLVQRVLRESDHEAAGQH